MSLGHSVVIGPFHITRIFLLGMSMVLSTTYLTSCKGKLMPADTTKSGIEAEAQQEAEKYWGSLLTKCAGTIYGKDNRRAVDQIYEFRDISIRIKPQSLSDADKMNGIEWSGNAYLDSKTSRILTGDKWGPWREGSIYLNSETMEKVNGQWKFGVVADALADAPPPLRTFDCSELP
jgi:hypothetical protein